MIEKRFTLKEIDNFNYGIKVTDVIMDKGIELPQSTVCDLLNEQHEHIQVFKVSDGEMEDYLARLEEENEELKKLLECSRKEANDYCEDLMSKDEFIRLYKLQRDDALEEIKQLKQKNENLKQTIEKLCEAW